MTTEKKVTKDKVFTVDGIMKEMKRFRWAKKDELIGSFLQTCSFTAFFACFCTLCNLGLSLLMRI